MENAQNDSSSLWTTLGRLPGGSISALAVSGGASQDDREVIFAGTPVGLYRSDGWKDGTGWDWQRLEQAPVGIFALAVSPEYATDQTVFVGDQNGVWRSTDGGSTWQLAKMPTANARILTIAISPNFREDGILFAGTLENGVIFSDNRGETWTRRSSGLLDSMVMSIVFSPDFTQDGVVFAGTDTGLFTINKRVRSWKRVAIPGGMAAVPSLAVLPDHTLFIGTETGGLFRSRDRGKTLERTAFPAGGVNALLVCGSGPDLLAAGEEGLYRSTDQGETWGNIQKIADIISLAASGSRILAGTVGDGLWLGGAEQHWEQAANLPARAIVELKFSDGFEQDRTAFMAGPQEGVWRTRDGGHTWQAVNAGLPDLDVAALALSPTFHENGLLAAACGQGVFVSEDGGDNWRAASNDAANLVAFAETGGLLAAGFPGLGLRVTKDLGASWETLDGPWVRDNGQVISLAVSRENFFHVGYVTPANGTISIWHGDGNAYKRLFYHNAGANPVISFWCPPDAEDKDFWYTAYGQTVLLGTKNIGIAPQVLSTFPLTAFPGLTDDDVFLDITGVREPRYDHLFVSTGRAVYHTAINPLWTLVHHFGSERVIKVLPSPTFPEDKTLYALLIGGVICQGKME